MCSNATGAAAPLPSTENFHSDSKTDSGISKYTHHTTRPDRPPQMLYKVSARGNPMTVPTTAKQIPATTAPIARSMKYATHRQNNCLKNLTLSSGSKDGSGTLPY